MSGRCLQGPRSLCFSIGSGDLHTVRTPSGFSSCHDLFCYCEQKIANDADPGYQLIFGRSNQSPSHNPILRDFSREVTTTPTPSDS